MNQVSKRKICFPITSRIHYARQKHLLKLLNEHPDIELQLIIGGSVTLEKYGQQFMPEIKNSGIKIFDTLYNVIDGGNHLTMAKTAGLTSLEIANSLYKLDPDIVIIRGDRFEKLAMAMSAAYLNKTIAHIEGGDLTGTIDESVRHAITKLAHIHFATNEASKNRIIRMGENPETVFDVGSPDVEFASLVKKEIDPNIVNSIGTGKIIDFNKAYIMVMFHPVTTENNNRESMEKLLEVVDLLNLQAIWFWPNSDAGTDEMAKAIRVYRELGKLENNNIRFITDILPEDFIALLKNSSMMVGNSSAGIKECSYFGVPVVNIGTRQAKRLRAENVLDVDCETDNIIRAIEKQLKNGKYLKSNLYYKENTSKKICEVLSAIPLYKQKNFYNG